MKLAYVVPRYGVEVRGGAEHACRMLAERLVATSSWDVHVFTTCATDAHTWADDYEPGTVDINGVHVHRFSATPRAARFDDVAAPLLARPESATAAESAEFIELQGPVCPGAVDAAVASDARLCVFYPYLYWPTVHGVARAGARAVMHPAAHDEAALRLPIFRDVFAAARGIVFQTDAERDLCERVFGPAAGRQIVLGLGVDEGPPVAAPVGRACAGLGDDPFILYVGRIEDGKGTTYLADLFAAYKARHPGPLKLVLAGESAAAAPPSLHADIVVPGPVSDDVKRSLMGECVAFVQPSFYEAFSLVLVEAWMEGAPVLVNQACAPLVEHCERSGGGLAFGDAASFDAALSRLLGDDALRADLARRGNAYVRREFAWPRIIERYRRFLTGVATAVPR